MTVQAYISRLEDGSEHPFAMHHERLAAIGLVKAMWSKFSRSRAFYAVVANLDWPPADALIVTQTGLGVLEFKHYGGRIRRVPDDPYTWESVDALGECVPIKGGGSYRNPCEQVDAYRERLRGQLDDSWQTDAGLPRWLIDKRRENSVRIQGGVWFTRPARWVGAPVAPSWFRIFTGVDRILEWTTTLAYGAEGRRLTQTQIETLVGRILKVELWTGIENLMPTGAPYGCLDILEPEGMIRVLLDHDDMCIGRALECGPLMLDGDEYPLVSRRHAQIRLEGGQAMLYHGYRGKASTNHTFVNGKRIDATTGYRLQPSDEIVLGAFEDKAHKYPARGACKMIFHKVSLSGADRTTLQALPSELMTPAAEQVDPGA